MFEKICVWMKRSYLFSALQVHAVTIWRHKEVPFLPQNKAVDFAASLFWPHKQRTCIFSVSNVALFGSMPWETKTSASSIRAFFAAFLYVGSVVIACLLWLVEIGFSFTRVGLWHFHTVKLHLHPCNMLFYISDFDSKNVVHLESLSQIHLRFRS